MSAAKSPPPVQREHDHSFKPDEELYRDIAVFCLDGDDNILADKLRFQISVNRQRYKHLPRTAYIPPCLNGEAVITVKAARMVSGDTFSMVIEDPNPKIPAHALIAIGTTEEDGPLAHAKAQSMRVDVANEMSLHIRPTKLPARS